MVKYEKEKMLNLLLYALGMWVNVPLIVIFKHFVSYREIMQHLGLKIELSQYTKT